MTTQTLIEDPAPIAHNTASWPLAQRIAFRFCFVYFILFVLSNQTINSIIILPYVDTPDLDTVWPVRLGIIWVAQHIFGVKTELIYSGSGSGDKTFDWVMLFCLFVVSLLAAAAWSALDHRRQSYSTLFKWFHLFLRVALGSQMLVYGFAKAVPLQMPFPYLAKQLEPFGRFSPMGILWSSIGASPAYEIFAGCAELLGGFLLIFPRTVTLGALVCLADMVQVFFLNMTYDTPVKIFSFHLILMSLLLLAPQARRFANFFFLNRPVEPLPQTRLFRSRRANGITIGLLSFLWLWMIGNNVYGSWTSWYQYGGGRTKSALYGVWDIVQFVSDGQTHPPLLTDNDRPRRAVFDFATTMQFQRMDDSLDNYGAAIDVKAGTLALTQAHNKNWKAGFTFQRPDSDHLILDGTMNGHKLHIECKLAEVAKPLFATRGFHWISEYPFNR